MADDTRLTLKARKAVVSCWFDIARIRVRVTRGRIYLQGSIKRMGEDPEDPDSNMPFLQKLDGLLRDLPGFRDAHYDFDNWKQLKSGAWQFVGQRPKPKKKKAPGPGKDQPAVPGGEAVATAGDATDADEPETEAAAGGEEQPAPTPVPL